MTNNVKAPRTPNKSAATKRKRNNKNNSANRIRNEAKALGLNTETTRKDGKRVKIRFDVLQRQINAVKREPARLGISRNAFINLLKKDPSRYALNSSQHLRPFGYAVKNGETNNQRRNALVKARKSGLWSKQRLANHLNKIITAKDTNNYARKRARLAAIAAYWKTYSTIKASRINPNHVKKFKANRAWLKNAMVN